MQKNPSFRNRRALCALTFLLFLSSTLLLNSCGNNDHPMGGGGSIEFKMNCVRLTRDQVKAWVDSGWTKPGNPGQIADLVFQFYSDKSTALNSNMQLQVFPGQSCTDVKDNGKTLLAIDTNCQTKGFTGAVILANNAVRLESLGIINKDGSLGTFDYVKFTPFLSSGNYIIFNITVVKEGKETEVDDTTHPCPPYCPAPGP